MPTGYKTSKLENGALVVHGVPLMGPQKLEEKHFKNKNIDRAWMNKALATFAKQREVGKRPLLWDAHNTKEKAARVIGRLDNLRIEELDSQPWLYADVIITDESQQAKFLAGGAPSKSVEFQPDNHYLRGLALLDGHEGHFDYGIPDFVPEGLYDELVALEADASCLVLCHSQAATAKGSTMTNEELLAALNGKFEAIGAEVKSLKSELDNVKNAKQPAGDVDAALKEISDQKEGEKQVELAKVRREAKVSAYTAQLASKTKTPEALVKRKLESFKTDEGMDEYFRNSMHNAESDVKLGIEREHGDAPDLKAEFEEVKARYKDTHGVELRQSFDDYKRLAKSITSEGLRERADRHNTRGVVQVRDSVEAFA